MILALAPAVLLATEPVPAPTLGPDCLLYEVAYAHLDTQWRWCYPQVIRQFLPDTMWDNFSLFERYPDYVFNFTGANRYRMMKEYWPDGFERVRKWVARGRWFPAGASWEENDVLVPSTESLIRQILFGQRFFQREFGIQNNEYMLPDCFGFPASLPSVLAHCGLRGFCTQKLTWHSAAGIPFNIGLWEGPDGQSVIAVLNPGPYDAPLEGNPALNPTNLNRLEINRKESGICADFRFYGIGDRGGAPREESVQWLEKGIATTGGVRVISAKADQFFHDITEAQRAGLPKYSGDLLLIEHSAGSLTSQAYMKRWNRKNELLAEAAEKASVAAHVLGAAPYPRGKINRAWELVLGAQFHDILPGTCHPKCYEYSWNDEVIAMNSFAAVLEDAVGAVARALDTRTDGVPLVLYNPLSIEREDVVEIETQLPPALALPQVCLPDGRPVPTQVLSSNGAVFRLLFLAQVPSVGFAVYAIKPAQPNAVSNSALRVEDRKIENEHYKVAINDAGDIASVFDKAAGRNLLSGPARLAFLGEKPSNYPAWNMDWKDRTNPPRAYVEGPANVQIVEAGPVRVALQVERQAENSVFKQIIRLAAGGAADRVEVLNQVDWQSRGCSLKAAFPLAVSNRLATYNWELGKVQRGNNEPTKYEVPSHQWFDLTDARGNYGVSILTEAKYGSDKPDDSTLRLTLLYSPATKDHFIEQQYQDWGRHEFTYALLGHSNDWRSAKSDWQAARLGQPVLAFRTVPHAGPLGARFSLFQTSSEQVALKTVKLAEDSDQIILRLQELNGEPASAMTLRGAGALQSPHEVNGIELASVPLKVRAGALPLEFRPYQLRSIACSLQAPAKLAPPRSMPVALHYDLDVFSFPDLKQDGYCDRSGNSIPAEMIGDTLVSEGITFRIGPRAAGRPNAVSCRGQTIPLPEGHFNRLYLLAMAVNGDTQGDFVIAGQTNRLSIQDWSGYLGNWDNRIFAGPVDALSFSIKNPLERIAGGFLKRDCLAWFCSHRHQRDGADQPYTYCYLFKYRLDVPAGAKYLTLPDNPRLRVLAVTPAYNQNEDTRPVQPLYDDFRDHKSLELVNGTAH